MSRMVEARNFKFGKYINH